MSLAIATKGLWSDSTTLALATQGYWDEVLDYGTPREIFETIRNINSDYNSVRAIAKTFSVVRNTFSEYEQNRTILKEFNISREMRRVVEEEIILPTPTDLFEVIRQINSNYITSKSLTLNFSLVRNIL